MKIAISDILVDEEIRIRKDFGNLEVLQSSIEKVGLINPILIDEHNNLIAGFRRLTACRNLGREEIEVSVIRLNGDPIKMLDVEIAENFFRKDFTPEEILATEKRRQEILEQQRKKGFFEKFWLWLKSFFLPQPQQAPAQQAPPQEKVAEKAEKGRAKEAATQTDGSKEQETVDQLEEPATESSAETVQTDKHRG